MNENEILTILKAVDENNTAQIISIFSENLFELKLIDTPTFSKRLSKEQQEAYMKGFRFIQKLFQEFKRIRAHCAVLSHGIDVNAYLGHTKFRISNY